jgi:hypothetical protein
VAALSKAFMALTPYPVRDVSLQWMCGQPGTACCASRFAFAVRAKCREGGRRRWGGRGAASRHCLAPEGLARMLTVYRTRDAQAFTP